MLLCDMETHLLSPVS